MFPTARRKPPPDFKLLQETRTAGRLQKQAFALEVVNHGKLGNSCGGQCVADEIEVPALVGSLRQRHRRHSKVGDDKPPTKTL